MINHRSSYLGTFRDPNGFGSVGAGAPELRHPGRINYSQWSLCVHFTLLGTDLEHWSIWETGFCLYGVAIISWPLFSRPWLGLMNRCSRAWRSSPPYPGVYRSQKASPTKQKRDRRKVFGRASTQDDTLNHQTALHTNYKIETMKPQDTSVFYALS